MNHRVILFLTLFDHIELEVCCGVCRCSGSHTRVRPTVLCHHSTELQERHAEHNTVLNNLLTVDGDPRIVGDYLSPKCPGDVGRGDGESDTSEYGCVPGDNVGVGRSYYNFSCRGREREGRGGGGGREGKRGEGRRRRKGGKERGGEKEEEGREREGRGGGGGREEKRGEGRRRRKGGKERGGGRMMTKGGKDRGGGRTIKGER